MPLTVDEQIALAWLADQGLDTGSLDGVLAMMYGDAYLSGAKTALDQLGGVIVHTDFSHATASINWDHWKPGHPGAAAQVAERDGNSGLARLLAERNITVGGIEGTRLNQLAGLLADSLTRGDNVATLAKAISALIDDTARADLIATTETARAMTAASLDLYQVNGVAGFDVLLGPDPCAVCVDEEQANPHDLADGGPPYHPRCMCSVAPVVTLPDGSTFEES